MTTDETSPTLGSMDTKQPKWHHVPDYRSDAAPTAEYRDSPASTPAPTDSPVHHWKALERWVDDYCLRNTLTCAQVSVQDGEIPWLIIYVPGSDTVRVPLMYVIDMIRSQSPDSLTEDEL